jgi:hypothetical protein
MQQPATSLGQASAKLRDAGGVARLPRASGFDTAKNPLVGSGSSTKVAVALVVAANVETWKSSNQLVKKIKSFLLIDSKTLADKIVCPDTQEAADSVLIRRFMSFLNYDKAVFCAAHENQTHGKPEELMAYECDSAGTGDCKYCQQQSESFGTMYVVTHDRRLLASMERLETQNGNCYNKKCVYVCIASRPHTSKFWYGPSNVHIIGPYAQQYQVALLAANVDVDVTVLDEEFSFQTCSSAADASGVLILFDGDSRFSSRTHVADEKSERESAAAAKEAKTAAKKAKTAEAKLIKAQQSNADWAEQRIKAQKKRDSDPTGNLERLFQESRAKSDKKTFTDMGVDL